MSGIVKGWGLRGHVHHADYNECELEESCGEGEKCNNEMGNYTCTCDEASGYYFVNDTCLNVDECEARVDDCQFASTCINLLNGTFDCSCPHPEAFTDKGNSCVESALCDELKCGENANCTATKGCECEIGFHSPLPGVIPCRAKEEERGEKGKKTILTNVKKIVTIAARTRNAGILLEASDVAARSRVSQAMDTTVNVAQRPIGGRATKLCRPDVPPQGSLCLKFQGQRSNHLGGEAAMDTQTLTLIRNNNCAEAEARDKCMEMRGVCALLPYHPYYECRCEPSYAFNNKSGFCQKAYDLNMHVYAMTMPLLWQSSEKICDAESKDLYDFRSKLFDQLGPLLAEAGSMHDSILSLEEVKCGKSGSMGRQVEIDVQVEISIVTGTDASDSQTFSNTLNQAIYDPNPGEENGCRYLKNGWCINKNPGLRVDTNLDGCAKFGKEVCSAEGQECKKDTNSSYSGAFQCKCKTGYEVIPQPDIDECGVERTCAYREGEDGEASVKCINQPGSYACLCEEHYVLDFLDGRCRFLCSIGNHTCENGGNCTNKGCWCPEGYLGLRCEREIDSHQQELEGN
ncbi:unnamed protein product [Darwinula stevensoni]|uniref:EGF-like domain-containing protein n=1 Tax=Darwinula stevensoni TaxID=69355 RepID=A0A7R8ZYK0_9CRUS|nr:unnamed protein product [Darwinula stevensoni]CAG0880691.1 unnamed protein product [Darwinula stevensoni]